MFDYFVWDYDGTLFDTYDAVAKGYHRACEKLEIKIDFAELRWLTKHSLRWAAEQLEGRYGVAKDLILQTYYAIAPEEETVESMHPYPGTEEVLKAICDRGGKNFVYSHRDHVSTDAIRYYGLAPYFTDAITKDDHFPRKPAPDALNYLNNKHGLDPAKGVMVGDRVLDVEAGLNAGMRGILFDPENFCEGNAPTELQYASMADLLAAIRANKI